MIMAEQYKALVRRYYQETMGDLSGIEEIVAPTFVDHHFPPEMPPGPAGVRKFFTEFLGGVFSDARIEMIAITTRSSISVNESRDNVSSLFVFIEQPIS